MHLVLIVAMTPDRIIGKDGGLPWRLPADLKHFKRVTLGHPVIMGRRTYESVGQPLKGRTNIVVTRRADFEAPGCIVVGDIDGALAAARRALKVPPAGEPNAAQASRSDAPFDLREDAVMILGGAAIYAAFLPYADELFVTWVHAAIEGDTSFPEFAKADWREVARVDHAADARNPFDYSFARWERVGSRQRLDAEGGE